MRILPLALAVLLGGCATVSVVKTVEQHPPRIVFTTGIEDDQPIDEIDTLAEDQERLCLSGRWFDLPHATHAYRYELRDGAGKVAYVGEQEVTPSAATWFTYSCYSRTRADKAGTWTYSLVMGDFEQRGEIEVAVYDRKVVNVFGPGGLGTGVNNSLSALTGEELPEKTETTEEETSE